MEELKEVIGYILLLFIIILMLVLLVTKTQTILENKFKIDADVHNITFVYIFIGLVITYFIL